MDYCNGSEVLAAESTAHSWQTRSRVSSEASIKPSESTLEQTGEDQDPASPVLWHIAGDRDQIISSYCAKTDKPGTIPLKSGRKLLSQRRYDI